LRIRALEPNDVPACESVLRSLPGWFGFEEANAAYIEYLKAADGYAAEDVGDVCGFIGLTHHFPRASEVHILAVRPHLHRRGIGRALLDAAEEGLRARNVRLLQVKTLGPSREDEGYARTRAFYEALGFLPLEELPTLWNPENPALVMVKVLDG
jgi:ribosomal protein S18 acetylase RimI-like enzyme